jgi:hypothetical protein
MGKRCFKEGFQAVGRANCLCFRMVERPQVAQRLEKFRCQN